MSCRRFIKKLQQLYLVKKHSAVSLYRSGEIKKKPENPDYSILKNTIHTDPASGSVHNSTFDCYFLK
jgi:hypothetical protein